MLSTSQIKEIIKNYDNKFSDNIFLFENLKTIKDYCMLFCFFLFEKYTILYFTQTFF